MSGFDERRNAHENKYLHDENLRFKANARRNKLLGRWAAEKLGNYRLTDLTLAFPFYIFCFAFVPIDSGSS